jgi:hypothetical protein
MVKVGWTQYFKSCKSYWPVVGGAFGEETSTSMSANYPYNNVGVSIFDHDKA